MTEKPKPTIYLGIDPGMAGAVAAIFPDGVIQYWHTDNFFVQKKSYTMPKAKTKSGKPKRIVDKSYRFTAMFDLLRQFQELRKYHKVVTIELQNTRPGDQAATGKVVGRNQGVWEALAGACELEVRIVPPGVWKPLYVPPHLSADKANSLRICNELFSLTLPRAKDEAVAEAIMIADYSKRRDAGESYPQVRPKPQRTKRRYVKGRPRRPSLTIPKFNKRLPRV